MTLSLRLSTAAVAAAIALVSATPAAATVYHDTNAGTACHAANSAATKFQYNNHYLTNLNTSAQYVICDLTIDDASSTPLAISGLTIDIKSGGIGSIVSCVAQTGSYSDGTLFVRSSATRSYEFASADYSTTLNWGAGVLTRNNPWDVMTLNCKMDVGTRIGLIQFTE